MRLAANRWQPCNGPLHNTDGAFDPSVIQCSDCEPRTCENCGESTHPDPGRSCRCWVTAPTCSPPAGPPATASENGMNRPTYADGPAGGDNGRGRA